MDGSEFSFETLLSASTDKHMMGPSKACFADTPRLASLRMTGVDAYGRARSQTPVVVHPACHLPHPFRPIVPGATARRDEPDRVNDDLVSSLLTHAPLLH
jgi:hypothetical protein